MGLKLGLGCVSGVSGVCRVRARLGGEEWGGAVVGWVGGGGRGGGACGGGGGEGRR